MGSKPTNTWTHVMKRVAKLEAHMAETAGELSDICNIEDFNPADFHNPISSFLIEHGVRYTSEVKKGIALELPEDQTSIDLAERIYRLGSKILQIIREQEDPTPYMNTIATALRPLVGDGALEHMDTISDILSLEKKYGYFRSAILIDGLQDVSRRYKVGTFENPRKVKDGYEDALLRYLAFAKDFSASLQGEELDPESIVEYVRDFKSKARDAMKIPKFPKLDLPYLERIASQPGQEALNTLEDDFGIVAGTKYKGARKTSHSQAVFQFLGESSYLTRVVIGTGGRASQAVKDFMVGPVEGRVTYNHERNSRFLNGVDGDRVKDILTRKYPHLLPETRKSAANFAQHL